MTTKETVATSPACITHAAVMCWQYRRRGSPSLEPRPPSEAAPRSFQCSVVYQLPRPPPLGKRQPVRVTRTLHRVQQTKPDSHAGSWPSLCIRTYTFPTVSAMLRSAPRPHVYTSLIMRQRNSFHKINEQSYDDDDDDDIAGAVFHLDRWAFLNLANSLLRSIST